MDHNINPKLPVAWSGGTYHKQGENCITCIIHPSIHPWLGKLGKSGREKKREKSPSPSSASFSHQKRLLIYLAKSGGELLHLTNDFLHTEEERGKWVTHLYFSPFPNILNRLLIHPSIHPPAASLHPTSDANRLIRL